MGILGNSIRGQDGPKECVPSLEGRIGEILSGRDKKILSREGVVTAAVLVPLFRKRTGYHVLLTKRSEHVEHHKGEISFPGGKLDDTDPDLISCALRETQEEIGVDPSDVRVLGELDDVYTFATGFLVVPFVGVIPHPYAFTANKREIAEVLAVPLHVFFDPSRKREGLWDWHGRSVRMVFYSWNGHTIWGATARILDHFAGLFSEFPVSEGSCP
ncbi:MAG: CoA pyrophosphatase [Thermodesulfobacteriota bacterium]